MQTATATVAGRRRVSFTLPEPAATTLIPRDVESKGRRSTWPPTRTERYPEGLRQARALAPTRSEIVREAGRRERAGVGVLAAVAAVRRSVRGAGAVARVAAGGLVEGHRFLRCSGNNFLGL